MPKYIKPLFLEKFIENPSYPDNGKYGAFYKTKNDFEKRYDYYTRTYKTLEVMYFKESDQSYYVWCVLPSELRGNTYDVVIHFFTEDPSAISASSIKNYQIQIFSNNPVMGFHFAYANFNKGILIPFLCDKYTKEMITTEAKLYNPKSEIGYDHSFYHAGRYLLSESRFLNKTWIDSKCLSFDQDKISKLVRHIDQIMVEYHKFRSSKDNESRFSDKGVFEKSKDVLDNARAKLGEGVDKVKGLFTRDDKKKMARDKHAVRKIVAKKSNATQSAVHRIKPKKSSKK